MLRTPLTQSALRNYGTTINTPTEGRLLSAKEREQKAKQEQALKQMQNRVTALLNPVSWLQTQTVK